MSENPRPSKFGPPTWWQAVALIGVLATLALLTANVWLTGALGRQQRAATRERTFWVLCQPGSAPAEREAAFRSLAAPSLGRRGVPCKGDLSPNETASKPLRRERRPQYRAAQAGSFESRF